MTAAPEDRLTPRQLADSYLDALARADLAAMLALFSEDAPVRSPLYGPTPARQFYPALFDDTSQSLLTLLGVTHGAKADGRPLVSIWFHFDWRLPGGRRAPFEVVDVLELTADGRIAALHIVYDTADVRPAFEQDTGKLSWHPAGPAPSQPPHGRRVPGRGAPCASVHLARAWMVATTLSTEPRCTIVAACSICGRSAISTPRPRPGPALTGRVACTSTPAPSGASS